MRASESRLCLTNKYPKLCAAAYGRRWERWDGVEISFILLEFEEALS